MNEQNITTLQRIDVIRQILDQLVEAKGREKAGYIAVIDDFLGHVQQDVLVMEEKLKDVEKSQNSEENSETVSPE